MPKSKNPLKDEAKNPEPIQNGMVNNNINGSVSKDVNSDAEQKPQSSPSPQNPTLLPATSGAQKDSTNEQHEFNKAVSEEIHNQIKIIEGLDILIDEKRSRQIWIIEALKHVPAAERRQGVKSTLPPELRKALRTEKKKLELELFTLSEDRTIAMQYLIKLSGSKSSDFGIELAKERAKSDTWLKKNGTNLALSAVALINKVYSDKKSDVRPLITAAGLNGKKAKVDFQNVLMNFLKDRKYELYLICSGKDSFKATISEKIQKALRSWVPSSGRLTL